MKAYHYIGLDVHKKMIAYCVKAQDGKIVRQGVIPSNLRFGNRHRHREPPVVSLRCLGRVWLAKLRGVVREVRQSASPRGRRPKKTGHMARSR